MCLCASSWWTGVSIYVILLYVGLQLRLRWWRTTTTTVTTIERVCLCLCVCLCIGLLFYVWLQTILYYVQKCRWILVRVVANAALDQVRALAKQTLEPVSLQNCNEHVSNHTQSTDTQRHRPVNVQRAARTQSYIRWYHSRNHTNIGILGRGIGYIGR